MASKKRWRVKRIKRALHGTSAFILVLLSLTVLTGLFSDPNQTNLKLIPTARHSFISDRSPASLSSTTAAAAQTTISLVTMECDSQNEMSSPTPSIRLRGQFCDWEIQKTTIQNTNNGWTATVFKNGDGYLTDMIELVPGKNEIIVRHTLADGGVKIQKQIVHSPLNQKIDQ